MNQIVLDEADVEKLRRTVGPSTILDASGHLLGYFTRALDPSEYEGLVPEFTEEELRLAEEEEGARTLAEILADLEGRK